MIKILFLASNPEGTSPLKLDEEIRSITQKIRASDHRDVLSLVSLWAVRPDDLLQALNEHKPQIVHFSGHGSIAGEIILMDDSRRIQPVSPTALKRLFTTLKDNIRVVLLNACYSRVQAEAIAEVIDCVIGISTTIGDEAATIFAASFYRAIGFGRSVKEAFEQGNTALSLEGIPETDEPQLMVRPGVNPSSICLIGESMEGQAPEDTLTQIYEQMPPKLKELVDSGTQFVDIPCLGLPEKSRPKTAEDYLFCELRMRQTSAVFVFRTPRLVRVGDAAQYLVEQILPHVYVEDYDWSFVYGSSTIPSHHTFATSGIRTGDTVYLLGDHRMPMWSPEMSPLPRRD